MSVCLALLVIVGLGVTTTAEATTGATSGEVAAKATTLSPFTIAKRAGGTAVWRVVISGTASGRPFRRVALLALAPTQTRVTTNGVNPLDVCLVSGTPSVRPETGAIHFSSNSACYGYRSRLDMGYVQVSGSTVKFAPDSRLSATHVNNHTASYGITACIYYPVSGLGSFTFFSNGVVRGSVRYSGFAGFGCGWSTYIASVAGNRIQ
ncbi:hypothetical protein [Streptomyces sp.]|uniref:hypothetical protein n=1 Tax=Streptomyces sp. TaxID=1931 RepID=UPI002F4269DB